MEEDFNSMSYIPPGNFVTPTSQMYNSTIPLNYQPMPQCIPPGEIISKQEIVISDMSQKINSYRMEIGKLKAEKIYTPRHFYVDNNDNWLSAEGNGKHKPIAKFTITKVSEVTIHSRDKPDEYLMVEYYGELPGRDTVLFLKDSLLKQQLLKYFKNIRIFPDCDKKLAEKCLYYAISRCPCSTDKIDIMSTAGFYMAGENLSFFSCQSYADLRLEDFLPDNLKKRRLVLSNNTIDGISLGYQKYLSSDPVSLILLGYHTAGLLSSIYCHLNTKISQVLVITHESDNALKTVASFLKVYNRPSMNVLTLDSSKNEVIKALNSSRDETVIFGDLSVSSNEKKRCEILDLIVKDIASISDNQPHNIAVVSNTAPYLLSNELQFCININGKFCYRSDAELIELQKFLEKADSYCIQYLTKNFNSLKNRLNSWIKLYLNVYSNELSGSALITFSVITSSLLLLQKLYNIKFVTNDFINHLILSLKESQLLNNGNEYAVLDEFTSILNKVIFSGQLNVIEYSRDIEFEKCSNIAVKKEDLMFMEKETLSSLILAKMTVTKDFSRLIKSLKKAGILSVTNNNTHPICLLDPNGNLKHISMYAFKYHELLSNDCMELIDDCGNNSFWLNPSEMSGKFLPLVYNHDKIAGRRICSRDKENCHILVTGMSGQGKTVFMSQLLASFQKIGNKVVVFDSSGSFSYSELCRNLSTEYVDENVQYYSIDSIGIPVNIFYLNKSLKLPGKKNAIFSILISAIPYISENQKRLLKTVLSKCIDEKFDFYQLIDELDNIDGHTASSLSSKLHSLLEEIKSYSMSTSNWHELITQSNKVIIITMENSAYEDGNIIFDMLIASLYNYQLQNSDRQLSIMIDEIMNQSLDQHSPISKILKEGRKYQMSLISATQVVSKGSSTSDKIMKQAGTKVFFKPDASSLSSVADMLGFGKKEHHKLTNLKIGECIVQGNLYNKQCGYNDSVIVKGKTFKFIRTLTDTLI